MTSHETGEAQCYEMTQKMRVMAEREGFEPSIRCRIHTFQACAFDHSATSPWALSLAQQQHTSERQMLERRANLDAEVKLLG